MRYIYSFIIVFGFTASVALAQDVPGSAHLIQGAIPKAYIGNTERVMGPENQHLDYIKSDSGYFPLAYFMNYMFYMNSRYTLADTGAGTVNPYLLQGFGTMYDTLRFVRGALRDTSYIDSVIQGFTIDSVGLIIGHSNHSATNDTIIVQIDSIDIATGYLFPKVLHADTVVTPVGLSPSNNWLNPITKYVNTNSYLLASKQHKFAIMVSYYGSKIDTMGFLPGFGYSTCHGGGSGPIPRQTNIGYTFGPLKANSLTWGYKYFFRGITDTIPKINGYTSGLIVPCSNPNSRFWYFQDNPISVYVSFHNVTGLNELKENDYSISQNYPNPFNKTSSISYELKKEADVEFYITDLAGRKLVSRHSPETSPGRYSINLQAALFSPGIYLYTFIVNGSAVTRKMVVTQ